MARGKSSPQIGAPRQKRLILSQGEALVSAVVRRQQMVPPPPPRSYDEARDHLLPQIKRTIDTLRDLSAVLKKENRLVVCMRLHPDMLAKSYAPNAFFNQFPALREIGSRAWQPLLTDVLKTQKITDQIKSDRQTAESKLIFVQGAEDTFLKLQKTLDSPTSLLTKSFQTDICKLERLDLLSKDEKLLVPKGWKKGRTELVFHPFGDSVAEERIFFQSLFDDCGIDMGLARICPYGGGPTFVSALLDRVSIDKISRCNVLRAARPLRSIVVPTIRGAPTFPAPKIPSRTVKSNVLVGMFDGGIDSTIPHLADYATQDQALSIGTPEDPDLVAHGTAVAGAILYGSFAELTAQDALTAPPVSVVSFRVLPTSSSTDFDLYEVIDIIEKVIPQRPDIKTFNISLGPPGAIDDDPISRFTWALDRLALQHRVTFITAVGNDGELSGGHGRIQAPADSVHNLSVGAYSIATSIKARAPYSCHGPGREGGKVKPDLMCFGGCAQKPFHVLSKTGRNLVQGTSFAAPMGSRAHAVLRAKFPQAQPLLGRVLMIHKADHPKKQHCQDLGFGFLETDGENLLYVDENEVTILYQGELPTTSFHRLKIPLPENVELPGRAYIKFTLGVLSPVSLSHPIDYTGCCVEDSFCPHWQIYLLTSPKGVIPKQSVRRHIVNDEAEIADKLSKGWTMGQLPAGKSMKRSEASLRSKDLKWDTIVKRQWSAQKEGALYEPSIILHSMHRRDQPTAIEYAAAVSIIAPKYVGDLYSEIRTRFPQLLPVTLRTEAELRVPLN